MKFHVAVIACTLLLTSLRFDAIAEEAPAPSKDVQDGLVVQLRFRNRAEGRSTPATYVTGEQVPIAVRARGITTGEDGKIDVLARADLLDENGKVVAPLGSHRANFPMTLGGSEFNFGMAGNVATGLTGSHRVRVTIEDQLSGKTATDDLDVWVESRETLALVHLRAGYDPEGKVPSDVFPVGQSASVHFHLVGCGIADGKSEIESTLTILDQSGKPIPAQPLRVGGKAEQSIYADSGVMNCFFMMLLNRSGDFVLRIEVTDKVTEKKVSRDLAIRVVDAAEWLATEVAENSQEKTR
ncbi:MAG TPA: hypothetical protein VMP01_29415 [Pirellulaceae bacterium]|nr:hypothetical protein [Pirellulaceae bacterium]